MIIEQAINTPWKVPLEILRYIYHPLVIFYLKLIGVQVGRNTKWYGFPVVFRHKDSRIVIGDRVEVRNWRFSNPLGINHPLVLTTWNKNAVIEIKADTGISGGIICAAKSIVIGPGTLVGANSSIIDTDFHPTSQGKRRYSKNDVKASPVKIGPNVFIGMNCQIIKGVILGNNCLVGAGSVVFSSFPANSLVLGNPAKLVKRLMKTYDQNNS